MIEHLDLDGLADVLAGEADSPHADSCPDCSAALAELRVASDRVTADLSALPPVTVPADVEAGLRDSTATSAPTPTVTTLPARRPESPRRWLPAAAAVLVLLAGVGYSVSRLGGSDQNDSSTSAAGSSMAAAAPEVAVVRNSTGTDYTGRADLAAAVPTLLTGSPSRDAVAAAPAAPAPQGAAGTTQMRAAVDPLARLRDNAGLAECLLALLPPDDPSVRPLALDYATYKGNPAMVVVLPSGLPRKLDVFVVGPACSRANDSTLFYTSVDKP